ncbi:MAG TPA: tetratricopeptide repeat protein, partial [Burkholderiaceae bacterium]|nr:tetratricopeptide repeat protein [Burkholderiaceae bacterium]
RRHDAQEHALKEPRLRTAQALPILLLSTTSAMAIDVNALWDFSKPALSEERFRAALASASGDDALILQTQIARTWGLRRDFDRARAVLAEAQPQLNDASAEAQVHYWLELGRTYCSATHDDASQNDEAKARARTAYGNALALARAASLDSLAIDTLHMYAFVDRTPADELRYVDQALALLQASTQPDAKGWEASLRNNRGYALQQLRRYDEALAEFRRALAAREKQGKPRGIRIAHWMIANTYRLMGRLDEAREIQLRLEREWDADNEPDPYVFEELEAIYRAQGNAERAAHYAARLKATR